MARGAVGGRAPGLASGDGRTFAGSGPASWRHDDTPNGIADMVGNVWERTGGLKLNHGRIYMPNDDNYPPPEASRPDQDGYVDASVGDGSGAAINGTPILSNTVWKFSENPDVAATLDSDYTHIAGAAGWQGVGLSTGYNGLVVATRQRMAQALIAPALLSTDSTKIGADAGLGALRLFNPRSLSNNNVGFRPALPAPPSLIPEVHGLPGSAERKGAVSLPARKSGNILTSIGGK